MDRRKFLSTSGVGTVGLAAVSTIALAEAGPDASAKRSPNLSAKCGISGTLPPLKVKLGHELGRLTDRNLDWVARYGCEWIGASPTIMEPSRLYATIDELKAMRDLAEKHGLHVEIISGPQLASTNINWERNPSIMLAQDPQRDRDIESFNTMIKNCAAAGIPTLKYNMSILGVIRTGEIQGRGDSINDVLKFADLKQGPLTKAGLVDADAFWERIDYFLTRVVPVANEYKINLACHPQDPGTPPQGYLGVDRVLGTVDGLKKFIAMHESPYHGLNFCQGTISEDLEKPNSQIGDVIRYFGTRKKIFNVHFRNIRGRRGDFVAEIFPDEGSVDMANALKVYREVGYDKILMPDHVPKVGTLGTSEIVPGNTQDPTTRGPRDSQARSEELDAQNQNFAFELGYIRGLIQAEQHVV